MTYEVGSILTITELDHNKFIIKKIIEGGMGKVLLLKSLNNFLPDVALKLIKKEYTNKEIIREANIWTSIGFHPFIAEIFAVGYIQGDFFIASK